MNDISNKKILFFSPSFFGYESKIKEKMESLGAIVDMFDERSITKSHQKALLKINPNIFRKKTNDYYSCLLDEIKDRNYDFVLFIKCQMATDKVLQLYKDTFNKAKFILYLYDSKKNVKGIEKKFKYFNKVFSFDRLDCISDSNMLFRPLFYCDDYKEKISKNDYYKYDLCFIGTIHSDRYKILKKIKEKVDKENLNMYMYPYLQSKFVYYFYKFTKKEFKDTSIKDFKFDKISSKQISKIVSQSKIIIDIQHPEQTGLTMRTIEMVGMNKKMITTNSDITSYDFYNNKNIQLINRNSFNIDFNLLSKEHVKIEEDILNYYSLEFWINQLLNDFC